MQARTLGIAVTLTLSLGVGAVSARTVVECVDKEGGASFRDDCPPETKKIGEYKLVGITRKEGPTLEEIAKAAPITLFSVPSCDACDLVRNRLTARQLPFTEKDVQDNASAQEEMKASTGGLTVPAVLIGEKVLTGYSGDAIDAALADAGYPAAP